MRNLLRIYQSLIIPWKYYFSADGQSVYAEMQKIFDLNHKDSCWELSKDNHRYLFKTMTELLRVLEKEWKAGDD